MNLDILPTTGDWTLFAFVRVDKKEGHEKDNIAFKMGVWPGKENTIKMSQVSETEYLAFQFSGDSLSFETGRSLWFSATTNIKFLYVDRIVAIKNTN